MKVEIIKPKKERKEKKSLLPPLVYLFLGIVLAFFSNHALRLIFIFIGVIAIVSGIKSFLVAYDSKNNISAKNVNLSIAFTSILIGTLIIILSNVIEASIRIVLGFFLIYLGISRIISEISFGNKLTLKNISSFVLILLGIYSIYFSNAFLVIIGCVLIANSIFLFLDYIKSS